VPCVGGAEFEGGTAGIAAAAAAAAAVAARGCGGVAGMLTVPGPHAMLMT
jgi:hypothetical protein